MCICSSKEWKIHGVLGVHVDDVIGGGHEIFDRIMTDLADAKWRNCVRHGTVQA